MPISTDQSSGGETATFTLSDHFTDPDGSDKDLTYTVASTAPSSATGSISGGVLTVITGSTAGAPTVTVTARDPGGLTVQDAFVVTVNIIVVDPTVNRPPQPVNTMPVRSFTLPGTAVYFDVSGYFFDPDMDVLTYSARTEDTGAINPRTPTVVTVQMSGSTLTVTPESAGTKSVVVTADDRRGGTKEQSFIATVSDPPPPPGGNRAPTCNALAVPTLTVGGNGTTVAVVCSDPDNDTLTYTLSEVADDAAASITLSGTTLTITPQSVGSVTARVTVDDGNDGTALPSITVTVGGANLPPTCNALAAQSLTVEDAAASVSLVCTDPDSDPLIYTLSSIAESAPAAITINGSTLTITPRSPGTMSATVTVSDGRGGTAAPSPSISVTVRNLPPATVGAIGHVVLAPNETSKTVGLASYFEDPEGGPLTYGASSSATNVLTTSVSGSTLTLTRVAAGEVKDVDVTATDRHQARSPKQSFSVTVCGHPTASTIPDQTIVRGGASAEVDLDAYFTNPNTGNLRYSVSRTAGVVISLSVSSGNVLTISQEATGPREVDPVRPASATVRVTASNGCGGSVAPSFTVTVRSPPIPSGFISTQALQTGGSSVTLNVAPYFTEPDGDTVTYAARLVTTDARIPDFVSLSMSGSSLTLTPGTTAGEITVDVTATDTDGSATQSFTVRVTGGN